MIVPRDLARAAIAVLAAAALACFFLPLFRLHVPTKRDREYRGADLVMQVSRYVWDLRSDAEGAKAEKDASEAARKMPLSVRLAGLIGVYVIAAAACAGIAALAAIRGLPLARAMAVLAALLAAAALLHIACVNWQVQGMFAGPPPEGFHPFARLTRRIGARLASRFAMVPGPGLWGMAACLALAAAAGLIARRPAESRAAQSTRDGG